MAGQLFAKQKLKRKNVLAKLCSFNNIYRYIVNCFFPLNAKGNPFAKKF